MVESEGISMSTKMSWQGRLSNEPWYYHSEMNGETFEHRMDVKPWIHGLYCYYLWSLSTLENGCSLIYFKNTLSPFYVREWDTDFPSASSLHKCPQVVGLSPADLHPDLHLGDGHKLLNSIWCFWGFIVEGSHMKNRAVKSQTRNSSGGRRYSEQRMNCSVKHHLSSISVRKNRFEKLSACCPFNRFLGYSSI